MENVSKNRIPGVLGSTIFLLVLTCVCPARAAETVRWEFAGWHGGGCYPNVTWDPLVRDRAYLTSDVAGIWRSDDAGDHWSFITRGLDNLNVAFLAPAPSDSRVLYAGTARGLFRSENAGENWTSCARFDPDIRFARPESHRPVAVHPSDPMRVIIGTAAGDVLYSEEGGGRWTRLGERPFRSASAITALEWVQPDLLWASSEEGLARYSWSERRWRRFNSGPKPVSDFLLFDDARTILAAGRRRLFVSKDAGETWEGAAAPARGVLFRLQKTSDEPLKILAAWNDGWKGGVVLSEDGGRTWNDLDKKMRPDAVSNPTRAWAGVHGRINALKADPFDPRRLLRTDWWGVWRSADGGVTWDEKILGAPNTVTSDVFVDGAGKIFVATMDNGLLTSADGGATYRTLFPEKEYSDDENGHVWRIAKAEGGTILATSSPWHLDRDQVVRIGDGSTKAAKVTQGLPSRRPRRGTVWQHGYARALAVAPSRPSRVYLGVDGEGAGGLFVSDDAGENWRRSPGQPGSLRVYNALAVHPSDANRVLWGAVGRRGGIYLSKDGGKSWRAVLANGLRLVFDVAFAEDGTAYAAGDRGGPVLFISRDAGESWKLSKRFPGKGTVEALCPLPGGRLALGTLSWYHKAGGRIYMGRPQGDWEDITGDLPNGTGPAALAYDVPSGTLYLARYAGSVYRTRLFGNRVSEGR